MSVPMRQSMKLALYLAKQRIRRVEKFPLVVELEPLFACNLACAGCGKIQYPANILKQRMSVDRAVAAVEECGAPVVSIAGGEPLIHPEVHLIAKELVKRKKFVYLCTNALLMQKKMQLFEPSPYFAWAVHIDGLRERHDESVCEEGVFDKAVEAIKDAKASGFRVTTNSTFFTHDTPKNIRDVLDFLNDDLKVDGMMISPAYAYWKAPDQDHFLGVEQTRQVFREVFDGGTRKKWRLNHTPLYLDFLEGKVDYECTPWGIPSYSMFGWQRPCYLQADGYAETYKELLETTDWSKYGRHSGNVQCRNCMAHCGYEPTAVMATTHSLKQSLRALVNT
jgi:hopanoid biosynthesis associated radical SAM protein HpnH